MTQFNVSREIVGDQNSRQERHPHLPRRGRLFHDAGKGLLFHGSKGQQEHDSRVCQALVHRLGYVPRHAFADDPIPDQEMVRRLCQERGGIFHLQSKCFFFSPKKSQRSCIGSLLFQLHLIWYFFLFVFFLLSYLLSFLFFCFLLSVDNHIF